MKFVELLRSNLICLLRRFTARIKETQVPVKCGEVPEERHMAVPSSR